MGRTTVAEPDGLRSWLVSAMKPPTSDRRSEIISRRPLTQQTYLEDIVVFGD